MMIIATYNVNSVNARLENLLEWLNKNQPDVVLLQEIKSEFNGFPFFELNAIGYDVKILGQKSYNGVAILSKHKLKVTAEGLPGFADENARYLEAALTVEGQEYRVASIYLPNGNPRIIILMITASLPINWHGWTLFIIMPKSCWSCACR